MVCTIPELIDAIRRAFLSDAALADLIKAATLRKPPIRTGSGERTIFTLHKGINRGRYSGHMVRGLAARNGVGNPRHRIG